MIPLPIGGADASATLASWFAPRFVLDDGILGSEGMPMFAVRLPEPSRVRTFAPSPILVHRDGLQVRGVHTGAIPAEMVNRQTVGDGTDQSLIDEPVRVDQLIVAENNVPVARVGFEFRPYPASLGLTASEVQLLEEPCFSVWSHEQKITLCSLTRALAYAGTHALYDILIGIKGGALQGWPGEESCIITELLQTPLRKTIHFFLAEGKLEELRAMTPGILAWARQQGCTHASLLGRAGWSRSFVRDFGFEPTGLLMEAELE